MVRTILARFDKLNLNKKKGSRPDNMKNPTEIHFHYMYRVSQKCLFSRNTIVDENMFPEQ